MKKGKTRKSVIAILIMISLIITTSTFAYWANYVEGTRESATGTLEVGTGSIVETSFEVANTFISGGLLVPENQLDNSTLGSTSVISLTHSLAWVEDNNTSQLSGTSTTGLLGIAHKVSIAQDDELLSMSDFEKIYNLIVVTYDEKNTSTLTLDGATEDFSYHITMDEPKTQEEYDYIKNATITIEFYYTINTGNITTKDSSSTSIKVVATDVSFFSVSSSNAGKIISYDLEGGLDVVIPSTINGEEITSIGDNAFLRDGLNSIRFSEGIEYIGTNAVHSSNLTTVSIPSSVEIISYNAFNSNEIEHVTFKEGIEVIRSGAFGNNNITSLDLPDSLEEVGYGAFGYGGNFITEISLGSDVEIMNGPSFGWYGEAFRTYYNNNDKLGGTYTYTDGLWTYTE